MSTFYSLLTRQGLAKLTNAQINQMKVNLSHVAVGDSLGAYYEPNENMTALKNEKWRGGTSRVAVAPDNPNWIEIEVTIPAIVGGFYIREVGVLDDTGALIAIAKYPETYKPTVDFGSTKDLNIKIIIELNNTSSVEVKIDPNIITASRKYVDDKVAGAVGNIGTDLIELQGQVATHLAHYTGHVPYVVDSGTANAKVVVLPKNPTSYIDGMAIAFKNAVLNTGAVTINVNGLGAKAIVKSNGNALTSGNLKANSVYTLRYNGTSFFLQGEGGEYGTASASDVLTGKTIGTDIGIVTGTMPNNGAVNQSLAINGTYTIPTGYHNGSGKVTQTIPTKNAQTYTPGTTNQTIAAGQYLSGIQTILGDPDLIAANIKEGINIFGVLGTLNLASLDGRKAIAGESTSGASGFTLNVSAAYGFSPSIIIVKRKLDSITIFTGSVFARTSVINGIADDVNMSVSETMSTAMHAFSNITANGFTLTNVKNSTVYSWIVIS